MRFDLDRLPLDNNVRRSAWDAGRVWSCVTGALAARSCARRYRFRRRVARVAGRHAPSRHAVARRDPQRARAATHVYGGCFAQFRYGLRHRLRPNTRSGSRRNIHAHYDIGHAFYAQWLDRRSPTRAQCSTAIFNPRSKTHSVRSINASSIREILPAGMRVLETGCDWGGFALHAARQGIDLHGATIAPAQLEFAQARAHEAGLGSRVQLELRDCRTLTGQYDGIVLDRNVRGGLRDLLAAVLRHAARASASRRARWCKPSRSTTRTRRLSRDERSLSVISFLRGHVAESTAFRRRGVARQAGGVHVAGIRPR
ncbi:SAM-dependent methyltransferase [Paraburkholderia sp. SG-MS1]|uniref:SAM-dependent methyltransferase n=1 Tax=Paraburkholderia sp. SG-MS1 TaxID=2023741 RepID=UPI00406BE9F4